MTFHYAYMMALPICSSIQKCIIFWGANKIISSKIPLHPLKPVCGGIDPFFGGSC